MTSRGGRLSPATRRPYAAAMVVLGLLVLAAGVVLLLAGLFTAETTSTGLEVLGIEVSPVTLFVLGVVAAAAVLWGIAITRFGARRALKARREHKQLSELSDKLHRVEDRERHENRDDEPH